MWGGVTKSLGTSPFILRSGGQITISDLLYVNLNISLIFKDRSHGPVVWEAVDLYVCKTRMKIWAELDNN